MANNTLGFTGTTGTTLYVNIEFDGQLWNGTAFEAVQSAHWSTYKIAMTEATSTGWFTVAFPATIPAADSIGICVRLQSGGSPAATDAVQGVLAVSWDGTDLGAVRVSSTATGAITASSFAAGAITVTTLPAPAPSGYGPVGTGSVSVNHDYPTTNALKYALAGGQGIGQARIFAYLASEYSSSPATATIRGQTITLSDGTWANTIMLDPGSYTVVFRHPSFADYDANVTVS